MKNSKEEKNQEHKTYYINKLKTKNSGITLIALVITIVVLLILAGVSLNGVFSQDGIFSRAELAKSKTELATFEEKLNLMATTLKMDNIGRKQYEKVLLVDICLELQKEGYDVVERSGRVEKLELDPDNIELEFEFDFDENGDYSNVDIKDIPIKNGDVDIIVNILYDVEGGRNFFVLLDGAYHKITNENAYIKVDKNSSELPEEYNHEINFKLPTSSVINSSHGGQIIWSFGDTIDKTLPNKIKMEVRKGGANGKWEIVASIDGKSDELGVKNIIWPFDPQNLLEEIYGPNWKQYYREHGEMPEPIK